MTLIADTSGLLALLNADKAAHATVVAVRESEDGQILVPDLVLAETDCMLLRTLGPEIEDAFRSTSSALKVAASDGHNILKMARPRT